MAHVSVCIPTYEMHGKGAQYLRQCFDKLTVQTFTDFDVVVSDHSADNSIQDLCEEFKTKLTIHYYRNTENIGSSSANANNAIKHATGALIKILFQDDFLFNEFSLDQTVQYFDMTNDRWLASAFIHTKNGTDVGHPHTPHYTRDVHHGHNRIGSPSVLTIKNDKPLLFDESLIWLMDCEYYKRLHDTYGPPRVLTSITVINRIGPHQVTHNLATAQRRKKEFEYVLNKYEHGLSKFYYRLMNTLRISAKSILRS